MLDSETRNVVRVVRDYEVRHDPSFRAPRPDSSIESWERVRGAFYLTPRSEYDVTPDATVWDQEGRERTSCTLTGAAYAPWDVALTERVQLDCIARMARHEIEPTVLVYTAGDRDHAVIREAREFTEERDRRTVARVRQEMQTEHLTRSEDLPSIHVGADDSN